MADLGFDVFRCGCPSEGLGVLVPVRDEAMNGALKLPDRVEAPASDGLLGDEAEPALDEIEPRGAGRREVQVETGMLGKPRSNRRVLVRAVVVADEVDVAAAVAPIDR